jgi:hypothetical protein
LTYTANALTAVLIWEKTFGIFENMRSVQRSTAVPTLADFNGRGAGGGVEGGDLRPLDGGCGGVPGRALERW